MELVYVYFIPVYYQVRAGYELIIFNEKGLGRDRNVITDVTFTNATGRMRMAVTCN